MSKVSGIEAAVITWAADVLERWGALQNMRREAARDGRAWETDYTGTLATEMMAAKHALLIIAENHNWTIAGDGTGLTGIHTPAGWVVCHLPVSADRLAYEPELSLWAGARTQVLRALAAGDYVTCWAEANRIRHLALVRAARREAIKARAEALRKARLADRETIRKAYHAGLRKGIVRALVETKFKGARSEQIAKALAAAREYMKTA